MWYLLWCDDDKSYSMIHEQQVLAVGDVEIDDKVQFFYGNKPYQGKVVEMDEDREVIDHKLKTLGATAKRTTKRTSCTPQAAHLPSKRTQRSKHSSSTEVSDKGKDDGAQQKDAEKNLPCFKNKKLLEMNRKIASMKESKHLLNVLEKKDTSKDSDEEWLPSEKDLQNEDEDASMMVTPEKQKRKDKNVLVSGVKNLSKDNIFKEPIPPSTSSCSSQLSAPQMSPSKEDLKRKLADMETKMQLFFCLYKKPEPRLSSYEMVSASDNGSESTPSKLSQKSLTGPTENKVKPSTKLMPASDDGLECNSHTSSSQKQQTDAENYDENRTEVDNHADFNSSGSSLNPDEIGHDFELSKEQLFGECADTVKLGQDIYCKKDVLKWALKGSTEVTHVARRLIEGVFKKEALLNCTLTGTPYRAGGKEKMAPVDGLNTKAVQTIISYAKEIGKHRSWPQVKSKTIRTSMTQRLGEIKRQLKKKE